MKVIAIRQVADAIREFALAPLDGRPLENFTAGAHVECEVRLPDGRAAKRAYSLVNGPRDHDAYRIAVAKSVSGRGGSAFMHAVRTGQAIRVEAPRNDFPLLLNAVDTVLVAGGIGVTPILSMARQLGHTGLPFALHYAGRHRDAMAYMDEIQAIPGASIVCDQGDPARGLDLKRIVDQPAPGKHLYVCGPRPLIEATLDATTLAGWAKSNVHFELFGADGAQSGDRAFTVEFARSGRRAEVPVGKTILEVMEDIGLQPLFDCRRGECGICVADVIDGIPDHRDMNLSEREKSSGKLICTCVSRAAGTHLVIDA